MAQYRTGDHVFYRGGKLTPPNTVITLPAGVDPSRTWTPLDDEAKKAMAKIKKADADREALRAKDAPQIDASKLDAMIESLVAKRVEAALAAALAGGEKPTRSGKGKSEEQPSTMHEMAQRGPRAADSEPV